MDSPEFTHEENSKENWRELRISLFDNSPYIQGGDIFFMALAKKGIPIDTREPTEYHKYLGSKNPEHFVPPDKEDEIETSLKLLSLSPAALLHEAAMAGNVVGGKSRTQLLKELAHKRLPTENSRMLFDPNFPESSSPIPALYSPLDTSALRKGFVSKASINSDAHRDDVRIMMNSMGMTDKEFDESTKDVRKPKPGMISRALERVLVHKYPPIGPSEEVELLKNAYEDLVSRVGSDFISTHTIPYTVKYDITIPHDYTNPHFLLAEELIDRGLDLKLFRTPSFVNSAVEAQDGLIDSVVPLADKQASKVFGEAQRNGIFKLFEIYSAGNAYIASIGQLKEVLAKDFSSFSDEEKKRLEAYGISKMISYQEYRLKTAKPSEKEYLGKYEERISKLKDAMKELDVKPADQIFLRGVISKIVDQSLSKLQ